LHSIMSISFLKENSTTSIESLRKALFGDQLTYSCDSFTLNKNGTAKGEITGGNLSLIHNLIGTKSDLDLSGKILFIEDLDEYLYHIDRMMGHLQRAGKLENLAGLVVGHFSDMKDNMVPFGTNAEDIIANVVKDYDYPVCFGFPVGHSFDNMAMICGREVTLEVTPSQTNLRFK
jgi:muramoyltetrapeptide carboxypeptidase